MRQALAVMLAGLAAFAAAPAPGDTPATYAAQAPLQQRGDGPWLRLQLPISVHFAAHSTDLRDLRIFNADGEALPHSLIRGVDEYAATWRESPVKLFPLRGPNDAAGQPMLRVQRGADGTIVELQDAPPHAASELRGWLFDASATDFALEQLQLEWTGGSDGFHRFAIAASDDLVTWRPWGEGQVARLTHLGAQIERHIVPLPGQPARYLRILWTTAAGAPELTGARLAGTRRTSGPAPLEWSPPLVGSPGVAGEFTWKLPVALPLERARITLLEREALAPVTLLGRSGAGSWRTLGNGVLYRLTVDGRETSEEELALPSAPVDELKLQVDARGVGVGPGVPPLSVGVRATEVVFLGRGRAPYVLAVGKDGAAAATLPLATLVPGYDPVRPPAMGIAELAGPLQATTPPEPAPAPAPEPFPWRTLGLWAVLGLAVLLLLGMALSLLRALPPKD